MPISPLNSATPPAAVPLDKLAAHPLLSDSDKTAEAARQFEAVLLRQILAAARRTIITSDLNSSSPGADVYEDMINDLLATTISRTGAFGLANALQAQWHPPSPAAPAASPTPDPLSRNPRDTPSSPAATPLSPTADPLP
jgi:flagellar protein FlgJ